MTNFSKLLKKDFINVEFTTSIMWTTSALIPPFGVFVPVVSTVIICFVSYYFFKWVSGDITVPIRDATKNHSWTPLRMSSKVSRFTCAKVFNIILFGIFSGLVLFYL